MTSFISEVLSFASLRAISTGFKLLATKGSTRASSFDLVSLIRRCLGPEESAVMYGRLISVCWFEDSSILAFSAASA